MKRPLALGVVAVILASMLAATGPDAPLGAHGLTTPSVVRAPTVTGPVTGGTGTPSLSTTSFDLARVGYVGEEYFLRGTATAFSSWSPLTSDGRWTVTPTSSAPYTTRIVVYRPLDPKRFNGTVVVEWLNVSNGFDLPADWLGGHVALIRDGVAWVGVSAQAVGVQRDATADPARYASLSHPGDSYSYDIFSQAGLAVRGGTRSSRLGGLKVRRVIATGYSQSAHRLVTYINAVQPRDHVFDGFLVHSRAGFGVPLSQAPLPPIAVPDNTVIRADLTVPVLTFETETDLTGGYLSARQPDSKSFRLWEVAGTAHADAYALEQNTVGDTGDGSAEIALLDVAALNDGPFNCAQPINNGPAFLVLNTAMHDLIRWVTFATPPPRAPRLDVSPGPPVMIRRDRNGNALGGIRTPLVDVPTATLEGDDNNAGGGSCALFGVTIPFSAATLSSLYANHATYVTEFDRATSQALNNGFLLPADAKNLESAAHSSNVRQ